VGQWHYAPATRGGEPVDVSFTIVVEFRLDDDECVGDDRGAR